MLAPSTPTSSSSSHKVKKICPKPLDQLMIHHTDQVVKPIIGNKDIEIPEEITYKKQYLPIEHLSADEFAIRIEKPESEEILQSLYSAMVLKNSL